MAWSLEAAERIAAAERDLVVVAPCFGLPWDRSERRFVELLRKAGARVVVVVSTKTDPVEGEEARVLRLVPGILTRAVADAVSADRGSLRLLGSGCFAVPLELRPAPGTVDRFEFDELASRSDGVPWLADYARLFCNNAFVDPDELAGRAWRSFADGAVPVALKLLERAIGCSRSSLARASLQAQAQGMRIATARFREVAAAPEPLLDAPAPLRGFLLEAKGWGLAMSAEPEDAAEALRLLQEARRVLDDGAGGSREQLYLLNILALSALKAGDSDAAIELELEVEARLAELDSRDWRLTYVNSMNIARLERRRGRLDEARDAYLRAFATVEGVRSPSDAVHANACLARLDAEAGRPAAALQGWLRAVLHLLAAPRPEALARRVVGAVAAAAGMTPPAPGEPIEPLLESLLLASARATGEERLAVACREAPRALAPAVTRSGLPFIGVGAAEIGVLAGDAPTARRGGLASLVHRLLVALGAEELDPATALVVDDRLGRELPGSALELAGACVRLGVSRMSFDGRVFELDTEELELSSAVSIGPAVDLIEAADGAYTVYFKRYLPPAEVAAVEAGLLAGAARRPPMRELARQLDRFLTREEAVACIRTLEQRRMLTVELPDEAAGTSPPTSASSAVS